MFWTNKRTVTPIQASSPWDLVLLLPIQEIDAVELFTLKENKQKNT